ncbi:MAG: hypothetical protein Udaeo_03550 [Candidatus Udaeobacter sp.]|nr:MAG: hypothetical protein Udaeo_03550 [Candidatus Udaeobacter sp.]
MPLTRAINHAHSAASDFLQNFVIADPPVRVPHFVFGEDRLERFARCLTIILKSLPQRAAQAKAIAKPGRVATLWALGRAFTHARDRIRQAWGDHVLTTNGYEGHEWVERVVPNALASDSLSSAWGQADPPLILIHSCPFVVTRPQRPRPASRTDVGFRLLHRSGSRRSARLPRE